MCFIKTMTKNQIVIGYTSKLFSDGLESMIDGFDEFAVMERAPVGKELFDRLKLVNGVDILIIELNFPGNKDLLNLHSLITTLPLTKIMLLSHLPRNHMSSKLIESGIDAYLLKSCTRQDMLTALNKIRDNKNYFCSDITKNIMTVNKLSQNKKEMELTPRENEILTMLVNCKTSNQIAKKIGLSENTVKTHRRNMLTKFGVNNLVGMVRYACRTNLIDFGGDEFCRECPHCM